jgi:hypothetical protein
MKIFVQNIFEMENYVIVEIKYVMIISNIFMQEHVVVENIKRNDQFINVMLQFLSLKNHLPFNTDFDAPVKH